MRSNRLILFFFFSFGQSKAQSGPVATEDLYFSAMQTSGYHSMPAAFCYQMFWDLGGQERADIFFRGC